MYRPKKAFDATSLLIPFDQIQIEKRISRSTCEACSVLYRGSWIGKEVVIRIFKRRPGPLEISISDIISRMARVRHANVALFMAASVNECDGSFAVVTELVANGSIETMMKKPSLQNVLHISTSVAVACAYLRRQGFVHGNLRPANILLDVSGTVKLSDYFVKEMEDIFHSPPCNRKSINYLAPEALRTAPFVPFGVDPASDVYSFGLVCMHLISGKIPYKHLSVAQIRILVGYGAYRPDTHCVGSHFSALKKIAAKCTLQDPLMRPTFERLVVALNSLQTSSNSAPEDALITFISGK
jgi:serine/threonine-protein kinase TNNI3K